LQRRLVDDGILSLWEPWGRAKKEGGGRERGMKMKNVMKRIIEKRRRRRTRRIRIRRTRRTRRSRRKRRE